MVVTQGPFVALGEIAEERVRQDAKWGEQNHDDDRWSVVLSDEIGEASKAILEGDTIHLRRELVQIAAVAVAWMQCIDRALLRAKAVA